MLKIIEGLVYIVVIFFSLVKIGHGKDVYFYAFCFTGCLCGLIVSVVNTNISILEDKLSEKDKKPKIK